MNEYIREVEKNLRLSRRKRREVLRDLCEIFESAREHGEGEADVAERLGSPAAYAAAVSVPLRGKKRSGWALPSALLALIRSISKRMESVFCGSTSTGPLSARATELNDSTSARARAREMSFFFMVLTPYIDFM